MEEKEGFIKDSKLAIKGVLNGIIGSIAYELILVITFSLFISSYVVSKNPDASSEQLKILIDNTYNSFPFSMLISCLTSLLTFIGFIIVLKFETIKNLFKRAFNKDVLKYGFICAFSIMAVSIVYNSLVEGIFKLGEGGNANQEAVVSLIKSNVLLGFLAVAVFAPIVEELTYRYCMFGGLCKYNKIVAYIATGLMFMAMHGVSSYSAAGGLNKEFLLELVYLPPYLFSGLVLAYAYDKTNNIGTSVFSHMINNLISFLAIVSL